MPDEISLDRTHNLYYIQLKEFVSLIILTHPGF